MTKRTTGTEGLTEVRSWFRPEVATELRVIAARESSSVSKVIAEACDLLLAERGIKPDAPAKGLHGARP